MRISTVVILCFIISGMMYGQNVLGLSTVEAKSYFKSNYPDLVLESNFSNDHYRYLKYSDFSGNMTTALVFLDKKGKCTSVRFIYDLSLEDEVIDELNIKFKKLEENNWLDESKDIKAVVYFEKEDWFITVNYKKE
jgi:hypothetical protein